jgi:hypothetical protein
MLKAIPKTEQAVSNKSYLLNKNSKIVTKKEQQLKQQKSGDNLKTTQTLDIIILKSLFALKLCI